MNAWHNEYSKKCFGNGNISDEEELSDCHISHEKAKLFELIEHTKPEKAFAVEKWHIDNLLNIDENASKRNNLMDNEITNAALNRTADNANSSLENEDEQLGKKKCL